MHQTPTRADIHTHASATKMAMNTTRNYARGLQKDGDFLDNVRDY